MQSARERILLVDDEPQVLVALEDLLSDEYAILKSESGERALDVMSRDHDIALLITDHRMPRMNGDELLARLGDTSDATRILITGYAELSGVIRAVNTGKIFAYLTKPWNDEELRLHVRRGVEHFRLSRELSSERQLFQDLMDGVPDGIFFKDTDLRFVRVNRAFGAAMGLLAPESLVGKRLSEVFPGPESQQIEAGEQRTLRESIHTDDVVRALRVEGSVRWFSETKAPIHDLHGQLIGLAGISRDVTERIATGEALRKSEQRLREQGRVLNSILSGMGDGAVVIDRDGKFLLFNPRAERILGFGPLVVATAELASTYGIRDRSTGSLVTPEQNPLTRVLSGEEMAETEILISNANVRGANVAVKATPLKDDEGRVVGSIALLRDVTEQRRLELQFLHSQKMEAVGRLASSIAHDFNNMLSVILSYSEMVIGELKPIDPLRADVEAIKRAGERATELTQQLLAFSRQQVLAPEVMDLNLVLDESERMLRRLLGAHIQINTSHARDLARVRVDPGQFQQVVMNLAVNARDAMPDGGKLTIETKNVTFDGLSSLPFDLAAGLYVMLAISDTGSGMDRATQARIFEPFFTTKAEGKGTGLGLSTVFGIVKQSGGHIWVYSEPGNGTTFKIYLPTTNDPPTARRTTVEPKTLRGSETILLVEDQDEVRKVACDILEQQGYEVIAASNAGEALLLYQRHAQTIDLLVTDVVMPQMNGRELADRLLKINPELRVLYMSGYTDNTVVHHGILDSGVHFLQKPLVPSAFAKSVREALDSAARSSQRPLT